MKESHLLDVMDESHPLILNVLASLPLDVSI